MPINGSHRNVHTDESTAGRSAFQYFVATGWATGRAYGTCKVWHNHCQINQSINQSIEVALVAELLQG